MSSYEQDIGKFVTIWAKDPISSERLIIGELIEVEPETGLLVIRNLKLSEVSSKVHPSLILNYYARPLKEGKDEQ